MNKFYRERFENVAGSVALKLARRRFHTFSILHIPLRGSLKNREGTLKIISPKQSHGKFFVSLLPQASDEDKIALDIHRSIIKPSWIEK